MKRKVIHRLTIISVMVIAILAGNSPAWAAEGDPDTSFSGDGKTTTPVGVGSFFEAARDVALQPDGKLVAAGSAIGVGTGRDFALARYDADGELDPSFGDGGKILTDMGSEGFIEDLGAIALQSDGKIVAVGVTGESAAASNRAVIAVARYNPNGSLDTSFSDDGKFVLNIGGAEEFASDVAVQNDGRILVAGRLDGESGAASNDFLVIRLNTNGSLDNSFDGNGIASTDMNNSFDHARAVVAQSNGAIVAAGEAGPDFALARYNSNGSLDTTFDTDGKVVTDMGSTDDFIEDIAIRTGGKLVVAGEASDNFAVARYNDNGSLDTNADADPAIHFDTDGKAFTDFGSCDTASALAVAGNNKVTVAGTACVDGNSSDFALARYNDNGSLDTLFSGDGKRITDFGDTSDLAAGISLQP
ncbi:MAG: hypothetical protein ACRDSJ_21455, partial [Rubrobacteraceae bacterium]